MSRTRVVVLDGAAGGDGGWEVDDDDDEDGGDDEEDDDGRNTSQQSASRSYRLGYLTRHIAPSVAFPGTPPPSPPPLAWLNRDLDTSTMVANDCFPQLVVVSAASLEYQPSRIHGSRSTEARAGRDTSWKNITSGAAGADVPKCRMWFRMAAIRASGALEE